MALGGAERAQGGFTLLEMFVVISIIAIALGLLVPALGTGSGRVLEGDAREFLAQLENARQIALAERTRTRVVIPVTATGSNAFGPDLALRAYTIVSFNRAAGTWKQRGKWRRLPASVAFRSPLPTASPAPFIDTNTEESIIETRSTADTPIDNSPSGTADTKTLTGAYVEFRSNGATSLNPNDKQSVIVLADGFINPSGAFVPKNRRLFYEIGIDPLTGSARFLQ